MLLFVSGRLDVTTVNLARTLFNTLCQSNWQNFARAYLDCGAAIRVETQRERERNETREDPTKSIFIYTSIRERERENIMQRLKDLSLRKSISN